MAVQNADISKNHLTLDLHVKIYIIIKRKLADFTILQQYKDDRGKLKVYKEDFMSIRQNYLTTCTYFISTSTAQPYVH